MQRLNAAMQRHDSTLWLSAVGAVGAGFHGGPGAAAHVQAPFDIGRVGHEVKARCAAPLGQLHSITRVEAVRPCLGHSRIEGAVYTFPSRTVPAWCVS
eukprot:scaffold10715_cov25-Tisochrysis_lutea.AAC.2